MGGAEEVSRAEIGRKTDADQGEKIIEQARRYPDLTLAAGYKRTTGLNTAVVGLVATVPVFERNGRAVEAFAIRHHGVVHAYVNACAHQAVELDWLPGAFFTADGLHLVCSLHGALYAPDTGRCTLIRCTSRAGKRTG